MMDQQHDHANCCHCPHHKVVPAMIFLFGVLFLLRAFDCIDMQTTAVIWPILVIIAGGTKLFGSGCGCCSGSCCSH